MASAIPYDPDDGLEHNPFATESSPYAADSHSDEAAADVANAGDSIYGVAPERSPGEEPRTHVEGQQPEVEGSSKEPIQNVGKDNVEETVATSEPKAAPRRQLKKYRLTTKVTAIERQGKKDPIIRFDAYTTLPRFRTTTFRDIRRTHHEFQKFFDHLNGANPECFVPSVPASSTSFGAGSEEDENRLKARMQTWLDRVCGNPILARDEEMVYFIEADFGYSPVVKRKPPATGLARKAMKQLQPPPDEVTELQELRPMVKRIYQLSLECSVKVDKLSKIRKALGNSLNDFGNKAGMLSNLESHNGVINMWRKLARTITYLGDLELIRGTTIVGTFGDGIQQVANDTYVVKEALTNRHLLMRELIKAQANTKSRHQTAIRVKGSTNISPLKVDEAINALEDATHIEEQLTNKVRRVSENMLLEKAAILQNIEKDIRQFVAEYAIREIEVERRALSSWESIRADIRAVDANGGLSRLGRESTPANRRAAIGQSQSKVGDSWSGDRVRRAGDLHSISSQSIVKEDPIGDESETAVDARNAASLLAGSTF